MRAEPRDNGRLRYSRMIQGLDRKDLIVLAADKSIKLGVEALLVRQKNLGIRPISCDIFAHPDNDPGVLRESHHFLLRPQCRRYRYAITICDREGCGKEAFLREQLETTIEQRLHCKRMCGKIPRGSNCDRSGTSEAWIWGDWNMLANSIRWIGGGASLKKFLIQQRLLPLDQAKPPRPKEALQKAMKHVQTRFSECSPSIYGPTCGVPQSAWSTRLFLKMRATLQAWFPSRVTRFAPEPSNNRALPAGRGADGCLLLAQEPTIRTNVLLVLAPVTVSDSKGKSIDGLQADDFIPARRWRAPNAISRWIRPTPLLCRK